MAQNLSSGCLETISHKTYIWKKKRRKERSVNVYWSLMKVPALKLSAHYNSLTPKVSSWCNRNISISVRLGEKKKVISLLEKMKSL